MLLQPLFSYVSLQTIPILLIGVVVIILATTITYQLLLSPLRSIPGPFLASISPFPQLYHGLKGDRHLWIHKLHQKYGTHVRVAPNFVSVNTVTGLHDIYGHGKKIRKSDFYSAFPAIKGAWNTHNAIDKQLHGRKRRVLSQAFSDNALKGMEEVMLLHIRQLCSIFAGEGKNEGEKKVGTWNLADWFGYLSYDVMGELCFGKSYDMLVDGARRGVIGLVDRAAFRHYVCGLWLPLDTWHLDQLFIRRLTRDRWSFIMNSRIEATARAKARSSLGHAAKKDFFHYLLNAVDPESGSGLSTPELWSEANVLMIAGSDTTSTELTAIIFYLVRNPAALEKVKEEVRGKFAAVEEIVSGAKLNELSYLKCCIDEAMRLAPAVPGALPRCVQQGGAEVDGIFLPSGTEVGTPCYSIHRHASYFPYPNTFIPERWIEGSSVTLPSSSAPSATSKTWEVSKEEVELARKAFCPFSIGPRGCIGKSMALMEMRLTLARLLYLFEFEDVRDGVGEDEGGDLGMVDHFTSQKTGPNVRVRRRV
ncbi:cytochrome P450 [Hyaloscypha variabilis F]|uniref:Cytochrome P450 n=1 Tax=Hyaloscypha variabilis (strain UAMH 11265 / GT02V1 / F) TaxID=1149755 RepID=A0A2J6R751_HYAVF|nr:cytochrome P450 [Hyaloscypha variabilis F]